MKTFVSPHAVAVVTLRNERSFSRIACGLIRFIQQRHAMAEAQYLQYFLQLF